VIRLNYDFNPMKKTLLILCFLIFSNSIHAQDTAQFQILSREVNSPYHDKDPVISPDGKTLFFTRQKHPSNVGGTQGGSDIWFAEADSVGNWKPAQNIGSPLNTKGNNGIYSISPDGNSLLVNGVYKEDGTLLPYQGVSISKKTSNGWSIPQKLNIKYYFNKSTYQSMQLANTGDVLLMSIEYYSSYGAEDLYVSLVQPDGTWSEPRNLGGTINTNLQEYSPFLAADGKTLYFSSNGHDGLGSKDIFRSTRLDDTWKNWSKPENLGASINTKGMETSFKIPASGDFAYFTSGKSSNEHEDIYKIKIPKEVQPEPVLMIKGRIFDGKTKTPITATIIYENLKSGQKVGTANSSPIDGTYQIVLPSQQEYAYYASASGYFAQDENIDLSTLTVYGEINKDLFLFPIEEGQTVVLNNVFFERSTANILEGSYPELDRVAAIMLNNPTVEIEIGGHTDNVGNAALNVKLSEERAGKVKEYLVSKGVVQERIKNVGYGGSKPIAGNDSEENKKKNRRVEFKILKK